MIFPVKRVKEELINKFAVSKMNFDEFSKVHSINIWNQVKWTEIFVQISGRKRFYCLCQRTSFKLFSNDEITEKELLQNVKVPFFVEIYPH